jgi:pilus assembly protein Flp/PilA
MIKSLKSFVANESGATAIEYALIASLIAVFIIGALSASSPKSARPSSKFRKPNGFSQASARTSSPAFFVAWLWTWRASG